MAGVFACPECGQELEVEGLSPGREILCETCSTWVEVPYLRRAGDSRHGRRPAPRSPWNSPLLKAAIAFAAVALLVLITIKMIGGQVRSGREKVLAELVESSEKAEAERRYDQAFLEIQSALAHARTMKLEGSARFNELQDRSDRLIVLDVKDRLAAVETLGLDQAVGEVQTLAELAASHKALEDLAETIDTRLAALKLQRAEANLANAQKAFEEGKDVEAFALAAKVHDQAAELSRSDSSRLQIEARSILEGAVTRKGVALPPVTGQFVLGSADVYTKVLDRSRADTLRAKGYLPQAGNSEWATLWDEKAPFRATVVVVENQDDYYLQSKNRTTQVSGFFELYRGDSSVWKNRVVARTRVPLPNLPALLGGHLGTADKRNPETERMLHEDAMKQFVETAAKIFRGIPARETALRLR